MRTLWAIVAMVALWGLVSWGLGSALVPSPLETATALGALVQEAESWHHMGLTFARGLVGLALGTGLALLAGLPCGLTPRVMDLINPAVTAAQACPPVVYISLLLVWAGIGSIVPVAVITIAVFPPLFLNIAQGIASADLRLLKMAKVFRAPRRLVVREILLPGIASHLLAGLSYALGITWKVCATAEFLGSGSGIGSRLFWAYRNLDIPQLFAWTLVLIGLGVFLELALIRPIRRTGQARREAGR